MYGTQSFRRTDSNNQTHKIQTAYQLTKEIIISGISAEVHSTIQSSSQKPYNRKYKVNI